MMGAELERIVKQHEMRRLEFKESFGVECIGTACVLPSDGQKEMHIAFKKFL